MSNNFRGNELKTLWHVVTVGRSADEINPCDKLWGGGTERANRFAVLMNASTDDVGRAASGLDLDDPGHDAGVFLAGAATRWSGQLETKPERAMDHFERRPRHRPTRRNGGVPTPNPESPVSPLLAPEQTREWRKSTSLRTVGRRFRTIFDCVR